MQLTVTPSPPPNDSPSGNRLVMRVLTSMESVVMRGCELEVGLREDGGSRHPFGVGRFVDPAAWMGAVGHRRVDALPQKYRSSPDVPPALLPDPPGRLLPGHPSASLPPQPKGFSPAPPNAMARRNERERKRVRLVNHGFATLRQYLPQGNSRKKLSKMETLRSAIEYIRQLQHLLDPVTSNYDQQSSSSQSEDGSRWPVMASSEAMGVTWEEAMATWATGQRSPGSAGSSPQTSLSPETDLIDFSSFS